MTTFERDRSQYVHPLCTRYAPLEMRKLFSEEQSVIRWRQLWTEIATVQMQLDIQMIVKEMIGEMIANIGKINFEFADTEEKKRKHDVMAHVHTFGEICPLASPIIHLGCTSCDITDNAELISMREGLKRIALQIARTINHFRELAIKWQNQPTLAYTHFQFAQPTTVGKRICMWIQDLLLDLVEVERLIEEMRFRGIKGTTGTQASFLTLFEGNERKVFELDRLVTEAFGFKRHFLITGQTYTRKQDTTIMACLASLAGTFHKIGNDIRLLAHDMEVEEPSTESQDGSSSMPYKRNPMLDERACSLSRYLSNLFPNAVQTHGEQWLERTLDDSAARRMYIPEAFLAADGILEILQKVAGGLIVYPKMIERNMRDPLQFLASEELLVAVVKAGGDRQEAHRRVKEHSLVSKRRMREEGLDCDFLERIGKDNFFNPVHDRLDSFQDPYGLIGLASLQVDRFMDQEVDPALQKYQGHLQNEVVINV